MKYKRTVTDNVKSKFKFNYFDIGFVIKVLPGTVLSIFSFRIFGTKEKDMLDHLEEGDVADTVGRSLTGFVNLKGQSHEKKLYKLRPLGGGFGFN